jgi:hypothetical protein
MFILQIIVTFSLRCGASKTSLNDNSSKLFPTTAASSHKINKIAQQTYLFYIGYFFLFQCCCLQYSKAVGNIIFIRGASAVII